MQKKILILAGSYFQIPVIEYAKSQGHYVITCDNRPDNPGHKISDEYVNVSTVDVDGVLEVARQKKIDGVLAYGTDPAAPTAAYVSEKLNLAGSSFESVSILSHKGLFREFLLHNGFKVPEFKIFTSYTRDLKYFVNQTNSSIIKPVDSSGSKGVVRLIPGSDYKQAFNYAMSFSRCGEVIIEDEIIVKGPHIHGEAFVYDGEVKFQLLGDQYFSSVNPCAPLSTTLPGSGHSDFMGSVSLELDRLLKVIGFKMGGLNIEIIRDKDDMLYFMEIGARNGGNLMPELAYLASGFDLAKANVDAVLSEKVDFHLGRQTDIYCTQVILHSHKNGIFSGINIPDRYLEKAVSKLTYYSYGDEVNKYRGSQDVVGICLFKFNSIVECHSLIDFITTNRILNIV